MCLSGWPVCPVDADCLQCNCLGKLRIGFSIKLAVNCSQDRHCQREGPMCERFMLSLAQNKFFVNVSMQLVLLCKQGT